MNTEPSISEAVGELRTVNDMLRWAVSALNAAEVCFGHGNDNAVDEALQLIRFALHLPHDLPVELYSAALTRSEREKVAALVRQRIVTRRPAAYLTGEAWFAGLPFKVDSRVLVPRSPLAELIEQGFEPWTDSTQVKRVLDLCTGGGCIAVACAHYLPQAQIDAVDLSAEALEVALENVRRHGFEGRIRLIQGDLFQGLEAQCYDVIVSNPPYVSEAEMAELPPEYHFEPALGLVAGPDGLAVVRRIVMAAHKYLKENGILVVEVGKTRAAMARAFPELALHWLEFERGGEGVFLIHAADLPRF